MPGFSYIWRRRRDSNPRAEKPANAFRVRPVMTTSIRLHMVQMLFDYKSRALFRQGAYTPSSRKALVLRRSLPIVYFLCPTIILY